MRGIWLLSLLLLTAIVTPVFAQGTGGGQDSQKRVTIRLDNADVRYALRQLFDAAGVTNFSIDPNVQGTVNISLTDSPFEVALSAICRQVGLTWRLEDGIYTVTVKIQTQEQPADLGAAPTTEPEEQTVTSLPQKIQLQYVSPYQIAEALGATVIPIGGGYEGGGQGGYGGFGGGGFGGFGGGGFGGYGQGGFGGFGGGGFGGFGGGGFGGYGQGGFGGFGGGGFGGFGGGNFGGGFGGFGGGNFGGGFGGYGSGFGGGGFGGFGGGGGFGGRGGGFGGGGGGGGIR